MEEHGTKEWAACAQQLDTGRSGKQCRERWLNHLRPGIKKGPWTAEEERLLVKAHKAVGNRWSEIARRLEGRTENSIKNRWNSLVRSRTRPKRPGARDAAAAAADPDGEVSPLKLYIHQIVASGNAALAFAENAQTVQLLGASPRKASPRKSPRTPAALAPPAGAPPPKDYSKRVPAVPVPPAAAAPAKDESPSSSHAETGENVQVGAPMASGVRALGAAAHAQAFYAGAGGGPGLDPAASHAPAAGQWAPLAFPGVHYVEQLMQSPMKTLPPVDLPLLQVDTLRGGRGGAFAAGPSYVSPKKKATPPRGPLTHLSTANVVNAMNTHALAAAAPGAAAATGVPGGAPVHRRLREASNLDNIVLVTEHPLDENACHTAVMQGQGEGSERASFVARARADVLDRRPPAGAPADRAAVEAQIDRVLEGMRSSWDLKRICISFRAAGRLEVDDPFLVVSVSADSWAAAQAAVTYAEDELVWAAKAYHQAKRAAPGAGALGSGLSIRGPVPAAAAGLGADVFRSLF